MSHTQQLLTRILLAAASLVLVVATVSACTRSTLEPAGELVPAQASQFKPALSFYVPRGTSGMEAADPGSPHWWFTAPSGEIAIANNSGASPEILFTATLAAPPCPGNAEATLTLPGNKVVRVTANARGWSVSLRVNVPIRQTRIVHVSISSPPCRLATDPRPLYLGLFGASVGSIAPAG